MKTTLEMLGLPEQLTRFNGWLKQTEHAIPALKENVTMAYDKATRKWVRTATYELTKTDVNRGDTWMAYNYFNSLVHGHGFIVSDDGNAIAKEASTFVVPVGPQAGKEFWTGAQTMEFDRGTWKRVYHNAFRNADKDGNPHEGLIGLVVFSKTTFQTSQPKVVSHKFNKTFTRSELLAMGITADMIAENCYQKFDLITPSIDTHLLNVATDLEQLDENVWVPNVYFNAKDDNSFNFGALIPPYAGRTPDFVVRLRAYNDSTNADYPEPNYSGMGNGGKCLDIAFENESVKPVRIEWGNSFSVRNEADEVILTFDQDGTNTCIGMCIEYKPLDGKKTDTEIYMDVRTGEVFHSLIGR
jgi:hypothetical protein